MIRDSILLAILVAFALACSETAGVGIQREALVAPSSPTAVLRRLSLDLRGRPPTGAEYALVLESGSIPEEFLDEILQSEEFLDQVEDWHAEILWPNISRYRLTPASLAAVRPVDRNSWEDIGWVHNGHDIGADPTLVLDEEERQRWVLAFESEATGITLRGGRHARPGHYCDMSPQAEYPDPTVVGTAANRYTVPASRSGSGEAYEAVFYSEEPGLEGLVMPIQDWEHCPNYCFNSGCGDHETTGDHTDSDGDGNHDCYRDMDTPGDDPSGRHRFDAPGMRCADGFERIVNSCNWAVEFGESARSRKPARLGERLSRYNSMRDGWRWQVHYWSRGVPIRTCAAEAQEREVGLVRRRFDGGPVRCEQVRSTTGWSIQDPSCGCGPQGVYCAPSQADHNTEDETRTEARLRAAIEQEPLEIVRSVVARNEDYLSVLTTRRSFVNGPLALAWNQQSVALSGEGDLRASAPSRGNEVWARVDYEDETWHEYERDDRNAGVLTTLEFLLRFPTARARVAQFRRVFACSREFDYAPTPDPADENPDIAERSGCSSCHQRLERDGMWFGRYPDRTGVYLDPAEYPAVHEACRYCVVGSDGTVRGGALHRCNVGQENPHVPGGVIQDPDLRTQCERNYANWSEFSDDQALYAGHLWPAVYRAPDLYERLDEGPRGMVDAELAAGNALQTCAVSRTFERLVGRPIGSAELEAHLQAFEESGRNLRALVLAIVESDPYRTSGEAEAQQ